MRIIAAGEGNNRIAAGDGVNVISAGTGSDSISAGSGGDVIAAGVTEADANGYPPVLHVHDEIVAETKERDGLSLMLKQIMEDIPAWAHERKFLITAECDTMRRYRK